MNIVNIALNQLKITVKSRQIILLLLLPVIMIFIMGNALKSAFEAGNGIQKFKILYVNEDKNTVGKAFDNMLDKDASKYVQIVSTNQKNARQEVNDGKYDEAVLIPENLSEQVSKGEKCTIKVISSGKDEIKDYVVNSLVNSFVEFTNTDMGIMKGYAENLPKGNATEETQRLAKLQKDFDSNFTTPRLEYQSNLKKLSSFQYFSASMLLFFMLTTGIGVGNSIIRERSNKIYMKINSFPVKKSEYLLGQILANVVTAVLQAVVTIISSSLLFGVNWGTNFIGIAVTVMLIILTASSIGVLFSSILNSEKSLSSGVTIILWFIVFIGGGFSDFPSLRPIGKLTFYKWGLDALSAFICGQSFSAVINELIMLAVLVIILWTAALTLFKRRTINE